MIHFSCVKMCFRETVCRIVKSLMSSLPPSPPCQKVLFFAAHKSFLELCSSGGAVHSRVPAFSLATKASAVALRHISKVKKLKTKTNQSFWRPNAPGTKVIDGPVGDEELCCHSHTGPLHSFGSWVTNSSRKLHPGL